jgi:hypothetical protein
MVMAADFVLEFSEYSPWHEFCSPSHQHEGRTAMSKYGAKHYLMLGCAIVLLNGCEQHPEGAMLSLSGNFTVSDSDTLTVGTERSVLALGYMTTSLAANCAVDNNEIVLSFAFGTENDLRGAEGIQVYMLDLTNAGGAAGDMRVYECESNTVDDGVGDGGADNDIIYIEMPTKRMFEWEPGVPVETNPVDNAEIYRI